MSILRIGAASHLFDCRRVAKQSPAVIEMLEARRMLAADVLMYHNDRLNTGQNLNESLLTPANVNPSTFGKLFDIAVDGAVFAQPLYKSNLVIPGKGTHNVLFVATEHDSVYAFDADSGAQLWKTSFIDPANGITTVPSGFNLDTLTNDIVPEVGITGTPVIDANLSTIYVLARTKEVSGAVTSYVQRLHALDITTGAEKQGGPVVITASVPGTGDASVNGVINFDPLYDNNRSGLTLSNGVVYAAFAGFGANGGFGPNGHYHGWILGYNAANVQQQVAVFNDTPDGYHGGIWAAGVKPAVDENGNLFVSTGDGKYDSPSPSGGDWGDSLLKLSPTGAAGLTVADNFTPFNQATLDQTDKDLGSGGPILLPDQTGTHPHEAIVTSKLGEMYVVDRDGLGGFNPNGNQIVQDIPNAWVGGFGVPAYFNGAIYFAGVRYGGYHDVLKEFTLANGLLSSTPIQASHVYGYPGASPSISANGNTNGIVWTIDDSAYFNTPKGTAVLVANNAADITQELYNSSTAAGGRDTAGLALKFNVPTVANGHVYVAVNGVVSVYGLIAAPTGVSATAGNAKVNLAWTAAAGASSYRVYRGTSPSGESAAPLASGLTGTTFSDTTAANGTKYYYYVTAVYGGIEGLHSAEVAATPQASGVFAQIDAGSSVHVGSYSADTGFTGGATGAVSNTISTAGVTNPAPVGVYQSERYGKNFTYSMTGLTANKTYTVRLHFAEIWFSAAGQRTFNVSINGTQVLSNFDVFAAAGGKFKANVQQFATTATAAGAISIAFNGIIDNAKINGIEILASQAPTFVTPLTAVPNPVVTDSVSVSALAADDGGEANVTYVWSFTSLPAGATPKFDINGYNGAKRTIITFNKAGTYNLNVTAVDADGLSISSGAQIVVSQVADAIAITPQGAALKNGATQQFAGALVDQFGDAMSSQPSLTWSLAAGSVGSITASGQYKAPSSGAGTATVQASGGGFNASVKILVRPTALAIDAGGPAGGGYIADANFSGGVSFSSNAIIDTSGIDAPAPLAVYQSERYGASITYTLPKLTAGGKYIVRLHFAETHFTTVGSRVFNVSINGAQVLSNFDIFQKVGANKADVEQFAATATAGGVITVAFTAVTDNAKIDGIEVIAVPFSGSVPSAVGTIEAENFDNGGQGIAYNDSTAGNQSGSYRTTDVDIEPTSDGGPEAVEIAPGTGGLDVNHITPGEWLNYTLKVPSTGLYDVQFRVSSVNGGFLHLEQDGVNVTGPVHIPNTFNAQVWQTIAKTRVSLTSGTHVFRLVFESADNNASEVGSIDNFVIRQALSVTNASWANAAANPFARQEGQGAVVNGKLYTFGGLYGPFLLATGRVDVYDPATNTWATRASTMPDAVTHSPTVVVGTKVWFIGGYVGQHPGLATARVQIYDTVSDTWSDGPALPQPVGANAAVLINNVIYSTGGDNPTRTAEVGNTYALDLTNLGAGWVAKASLANPRDHLGGVAINGKFYVAGGQTGPDSGATLSDELDIYDPATNTWSRGANLPSPDAQINAATFVLNGKLIVAGGEISHNVSTDQVYSYDPVLNRWSIMTPLPGVRRAAIAGAINGQIIFTTGWDFNGGDHAETYIGTLT